MVKPRNDTPFDQIDQLLRYDPESGKLFWRVSRGQLQAGSEAGTITAINQRTPYIRMLVNRRPYLAHRVAWLLMTGSWPVNQIDHRNGDGLDNRWCNLRQADASLNMRNQALKRTTTSGFRGVNFRKRTGKWKVEITHNEQRLFLGYFDDLEDAVLKRLEAEHELWTYHPENRNA